MEVHAPSRSATGQYYSDDIELMEKGEVVNDTEEEGNVGKEIDGSMGWDMTLERTEDT